MNAKQKLHQTRLNEWAVLCANQKASGLTVRQWCEREGISFHKYNYWKHLLKEEAASHLFPDIVPLFPSAPISLESPAQEEIQTIPVTGSNCTNRANYPNAKVDIKLRIDGVCIELEPSVSEDFLRSLVRAVHYA